MRKTTRSILLLIVVVTVLAAAVAAEIAHERASLPMPLTALDPTMIHRIEIRCAACTTRRFERDSTGWQMLEPYAQPANPEAVMHLIAIARASVRNRQSLHDYDPAKLGLAPPQITLTLDSVTIDFGNEDPIEHDRYVRIGDELLRVPDHFSARLLEAPENELANPPVVHKD
jgi:uncharacterized protein DUF4340